jgi:hypothetical protein
VFVWVEPLSESRQVRAVLDVPQLKISLGHATLVVVCKATAVATTPSPSTASTTIAATIDCREGRRRLYRPPQLELLQLRHDVFHEVVHPLLPL